MSAKYEKLKSLLEKLFQLDQPDLDFGLYRVMRVRRNEVMDFLGKHLKEQTKQAFQRYESADKAKIEKDLRNALEQAREDFDNPEDSRSVKRLRAKLQSEAVDVDALEGEVFDHLYNFFRRYYSNGDFLAKRVYKKGVYAIPYEGEEVTLHWANEDQYYIKTSEYLQNYAFRLRPENETAPMRVVFQLSNSTEGEHGSIKPADDNGRVFILAEAEDSEGDFLDQIEGEQGPELVIRFEYRSALLTDWPEDSRAEKKKPPAQDALIAEATQRILSTKDIAFTEWITELAEPHLLASGKQAKYSRLEVHLRRYAARNTFDYFIHKDLSGFLRRELDFYIKNEVMRLDDVENESALRVEQYLSKIKVIRRIAHKIIDFLAQLEDFQKKLWLKKKFVVDTQYCITLDRIPEEFYPIIAANDSQRQEWAELFPINETGEDCTQSAYSKPLNRAFLSENQRLVIDTRHFQDDFTAKLLSAIGDLEGSMQGVALHADNFHALRLLSTRYRNDVRAVYVDPPYNTGNDEFVYKDNYQHSSWLTAISSVALLTRNLLTENGNFFCSISDIEAARLNLLLDDVFSYDSRVAVIAYERSGSSGLGQGGKIVNTKENILAYSLRKADLNDIVHSRPIEYATLKRYNKVLINEGAREKVFSFIAPSTGEEVTIFAHQGFKIGSISLRKFKQRKAEILEKYRESFDHVFRLTGVQKENEFQNRILAKCKDGLFSADYLVSRGKLAGQWVTTYYYEGQIFVWLKNSARLDGGALFKENKITDHWPHSEIPKADLANEGGVTLSRGKKPEYLLKRLIEWGSNERNIVLDYFSGSGTTAAVACKTGRKFIAVDNERYFDGKTLRRLKNVLYGDSTGISKSVGWSGGGFFKYLRLESYEDALNNLEVHRTDYQQELIDVSAVNSESHFKEEYILRYMLDVETRGSQSLLNTRAFSDPTAYKLTVKNLGAGESREVNVDLIETFNWLLGLRVKQIVAPQAFSAQFERDNEKRLRLAKGLEPDKEGPHWFRKVTGGLPDGRRALVIWRKLTGDLEQDNLVLDEWFAGQRASSGNNAFDLVYVNGSSNLENIKTPSESWKVRLIEDDFHRLMFEGT